jgi:hypothetical protein
MRRRKLLQLVALSLLGCASGPPSRLHTLGKPSDKPEIRFEIENRSSVIVNSLYIATSDQVRVAGRKALESGTAEQAALWGDDLLTKSGLEKGGRVRVPISVPGRYDVRAVDRDGREQHIAGLRLSAGGRYRLELEDGSWRTPR